MTANGQDDKSFAKLVGRNRSQIYRIRKGHSQPSDELKVTIAKKTNGAVPLEVWFPKIPQRRAA